MTRSRDHDRSDDSSGVDRPGVPDEVDAGQLVARVKELESQLRYTLADLDNVRKRFEDQFARERRSERERAGRIWIPILDTLDLAVQHPESRPDQIRAGVDSVRIQAIDAMAKLGFTRFEDVGDAFDPQRHEAVTTIASDAPPGTVIDAVRPGYDGDPVLRPASVVVARSLGDG